MANEATVVIGKLDDKALRESIDSLVNTVNLEMGKLAKGFDESIMQMNASLKKLGSTNTGSGGTSDGGSGRRTKAQQEEAKAAEATKNVYDQQADAMQKATTNAKTYSEEVMKTAASIREMKEWQEKGFVIIGDRHYYNPETSLAPLKTRKTLEDQITIALKEQAEAEARKTKEEEVARKEAEREGEAAQSIVRFHREDESVLDRQLKLVQEKIKKYEEYIDTFGKRYTGTSFEEIEKQDRIFDSLLNKRTELWALERRLLSERKPLSTQEVNRYGLYDKEEVKNIDEVRNAIANLLNIEEAEVKKINLKTSSYNQLTAYLKQVQAAYKNLDGDLAKSGSAGKILADEMIRVNREIQKIQSAQSRPSNLKSILDFEPKTLDDMTYKMQLLARYRNGIDTTDKAKAGEINEVNKAYAQLQKKQQEILGQNKSMLESNNALSRSFNYMKNRLAFYFTVGASTRFVNNLIEIRSQYEMNERALGILINSAERGTQIFNELSQMALVSPYTLIELSAAAKQLTAYDIAARDVVDTTRRLADMASAVGVPIERLTYALGQIKAYGYLNARDARMFANAGIPLVKQLSEYYTELEGKIVSTADVYDRIKKKSVDYNEVMQVVNKMTDEGGKFFDFQAKMADTLKVRLANLTLAWNNMLNEIGSESQGMLSWSIGALKDLFLAWKSIDKTIWNLIYTFGVFKAGQFAYYAWLAGASQRVGAAFAAQYVAGQRLTNIFKSMGGAISSLAVNWQMLAAAALAYIAVDVVATLARNSKAIRELNAAIAENAENAANSIDKLITSESMVVTRSNALLGKLSKKDAEKAWEALRDEIDNSSIAADRFIAKLVAIEDMNERVLASIHMAEDIRDAEYKLSNLRNELKVDQDTAINGLFGEGLAEDIEDYLEHLEHLSDVEKFNAKRSRGFWESVGMLISSAAHGISEEFGNSFKEATKEADEFAENAAIAIRKVFGNDINGNMLTEAIARMEKELIEKNPKITGAGISLLEESIDKVFSYEFGGMYDKQGAAVQKFLDQLKHDYASAFSQVTDDILDNTRKWDKSQVDAFNNTFEKLKKDIPESWAEILDEMLKDMNSREWKIQVVAKMNIGTRSDFQKDFDKRIGLAMADAYKKYRPKEGDELPDWAGGMQDKLKKLKEEQESYEKDSSAYAQERKKNVGDEIKQMEYLLKLYGQPLEKDKNKSKKDVLGEALQKEVEIVTNMQKKFNEYRNAGVSAQEAVAKATEEYGSTLKSTNATLAKYGIGTKSGNELSQMRMRDIRDYFVSLREEAVKLGNTKGIEALEKGIANLNVEITKLDYKRITEGLNNELAKLKDEYELSVELGADPELGDMFTSLFDIDPNQLPKTIDEYAERVLQRLNAYFRNTKVDLQLPTLNLTDADLDSYRQMLYDDKITQDAFSAIESSVKAIREMRYKEVRDLHSQIKDLQYELADQYGKIEIEEKKRAVLRKRLANESREEQRKLLELQIEKQEQVITELKSGILQLMPTYKKLFGDVSEYSAATTRRLANNLKQAYLNAQKNVVGVQKKGDKLVALYQYVDPESGETVIMTMKELGQAIEKVDNEASKSKSTFEKMKDAFDGNSEGVKDFAKGIEIIGEELNKVSEGVRTAGNIAEALGADEETVGVINDIGQALDGLGQVAQGISQMATDPIGGVVNVVGGLFSAIGSLFNGYNRRINREIKKSEEAVDQLSLAYQRLEFAVEKSMGSAETYWRRAAIENKKMQLEELQRQLVLEESRKKKDQDKDKQNQLRSQIISLQQEIDNMTEEVVSTLTGSDVKSAAEEFVDTWVQAWKAGETTLDAMEEKMDSVIENIIKKAMTNKIVGAILDPFYKEVDRMTGKWSEGGEELTIAELRTLAEKAGVTANDINVALGEFYGNLEGLGIISKTQEESKQLSALQQGISSITEETASALEAYANSISQQVYLHSTLLTEIRDILLGGDSDMSMGVQAQMLLQLQQSFQVQMAIQNILLGWSNANGMAMRVELI